jgi:predicted nucleic acid-binding protein
VKEEKRATKTKSLLKDLTRNGFEIVSVTFQIADLAAHLKARRGGRLPDALIAATAIDQGANLIYSQDEGLKRFSEEIQVSKLK